MLDGTLNVTLPSATAAKVLHADNYAYIPADSQHVLSSDNGAGLLLFERRYVVSGQHPWLLRSPHPLTSEPCLHKFVQIGYPLFTFVLHGDPTVRPAQL